MTIITKKFLTVWAPTQIFPHFFLKILKNAIFDEFGGHIVGEMSVKLIINPQINIYNNTKWLLITHPDTIIFKIRVNKNQENAFFGDIWIDTKKSCFIHFFKAGKNIMSLLKQNIQIPPPLSTDWHP